jgi:sigma-B regulation protein RsbU (phosphoserine phosphatase)
LDADEEGSACELGDTYPPAENSRIYFDTLEAGIPAFITNTEKFGWLCTAGAPISIANGKVVALAFADVSMDEVMSDRYHFLLLICIVLIIAAAAATAIVIALFRRYVVSPINALSEAAARMLPAKTIIVWR